MESFKFFGGQFLWIVYRFLVYLWGCKFVDAWVCSFSKKDDSKFVFVEDENLWRRASHEYHKN